MQVTITKDALWSAADVLRDHSGEAPTDAIKSDIETLAEALARIGATTGSGDRKARISVTLI